jgi:alpha-L-rhamnosidase
MYGTIVSGWELREGDLEMEVEVPVNTGASIHVPGTPGQIEVNGVPLTEGEMEYVESDEGIWLEAGSGKYRFNVSDL